ncbi:MAG TPA: UDP-N-acetylmuramoyl-tripeptide--D-alanyl-D-alanine ligase [Acidimicrobiales bacterium]
MQLRTSELAAAVSGRLVGPDVVVDGATQDSRAVRPGQLFVPLVAERDGHAFVAAAIEAGAGAYLTSADPLGGTAIVVADTLAALQDAGRLARTRLPAPVVGITGSVGKTSVKDMLAAVLRQRMAVAASERSFNNEIGVPLTLLGAPDGTEAVVVEMGARGVGHIADLCSIALPTVGIVTRVAAVHTEAFGTVDDVARAKSELVAALPPTGTAVLNADDERVVAMRAVTSAEVVTYGTAGDVTATDIVLDEALQGRYRLRSPWGDVDVALAVRGRHQIDNSLAAAAAALVCGVDVDAVAAGLATAALSPWRMELKRAPSGVLVLNDAYNANPTSVAAALESLAALPARRRVAVLGVMAELGPSSDQDHAEVAERARQLGIEVLTVAAPAYGASDVADVDAAAAELGDLGDGDAVLVKGSRVAGLERLAALLLVL